MKVVFTWFEGKATKEVAESFADGNSAGDVQDQGEKHICSHKGSELGSRNCAESNDGQVSMHPIDDILHWHNSIRMDMHDIAEETRKVQQSGDFSDISAFNERLQFIADVCIYHRCVDLDLYSGTCGYGHVNRVLHGNIFLVPLFRTCFFLFS